MARSLRYSEPLWVERGTRFQGFQNLMRLRIRDVLLVSSLYDLYLFEEDGRLYERIRNEYQGLNLSHSPELTRVSNGRDAIEMALEQKRFDLIITTLHIEDMSALQLAQLARKSHLDVPIVLLAHDDSELALLMTQHDTSVFDKVFVWLGDFRVIISIIKHLEDKMNVAHDTDHVGVQVIILIEDDVRYYSSYLPLLYGELLNQSHRLISEGVNLSHKYLRMRARPKILLCSTYEEAWESFQQYGDYLLGIISDVDFPRQGRSDGKAGIRFVEAVREIHGDVPILFQSKTLQYAEEIAAANATFLLKNSPTLHRDLRQFMIEHWGFGDFVFRTPDRKEVGRASDLKTLEAEIHHVPEGSLRYHGERNHFSSWLKARTEFWLANSLKSKKVSDYASVESLRRYLISTLKHYRKQRQEGLIADFRKETFDPASSFARIGGGSLGGKARGLGFVNILINNYGIKDRFEGINIQVPPAVVLGTDVFDQFLDDNGLRDFALSCRDDQEIIRRFLAAEKFRPEIRSALVDFLDLMHEPLAVRSSSQLEDSQYHPFAGVYQTYMIPNNHPNRETRLRALINAVKRIYASTFSQSAKDYVKVTSYRHDDEKMAVIIQKMVGSFHDSRFYPDFSGVAKSHNFYPLPPQKAQDGIVSVALGLGRMVIEGGMTVRFCSKYPYHVFQLFSPQEALRNSQKEFYAMSLQQDGDPEDVAEEDHLRSYGLDIAEKDGTLYYVGSTYSHENNALYDGLSRSGVRVVTFSPILRSKIFPLCGIIDLLLEKGIWGMGTAVEIEFAVTMSAPRGKPREFGVLQMRPMVLNREIEQLEIGDVETQRPLCWSSQVLGHGIVENIHDIVVVDIRSYERTQSLQVVSELAKLNEMQVTSGRPYLLIGVGRWGSLDPYLGIPVKWDQISGARAIVESSFRDLEVAPSQGSHFFHNITSFSVGYFCVNSKKDGGFIDWKWLAEQPAVLEKTYTRLLRLPQPVIIKMNSHQSRGVILKPASS